MGAGQAHVHDRDGHDDGGLDGDEHGSGEHGSREHGDGQHGDGHDGHGHDGGHDGHRHGDGRDGHRHDGGHDGHRHGDGHDGHRHGGGAHGHDDGHPHGDEAGHDPGGWAGLRHRLGHLARPHSHDAADKVDPVMEASAEGIRTLWLSLLTLGATALAQAAVVIASGSIALLGDTLHNVADALTAVPLGLAFLVGRRPATRRYTYGYGRAEDLAGLAIVAAITASSVLAGYEAIRRLLDPRPVHHLWAVALAAIIGFAGNEIVARYRIAVGRRIGSAALTADGLHARTDGFTSLAVLLGAGGVALGWRWADPVVGLLITVAIAAVLKDAARQVYRRLMDAVDPDLVTQIESVLRDTPGVLGTHEVRLRWIGHQLRAEAAIAVAGTSTVTQAHTLAHDAEHRLIHAVPRLTAAFVHAEPSGGSRADNHEPIQHHRSPGSAIAPPEG